jgi:hypothetical protein
MTVISFIKGERVVRFRDRALVEDAMVHFLAMYLYISGRGDA